MPEPGILHHVGEHLAVFQFGTRTSISDQHLLLWVGGLGDTLLSVAYVSSLSINLPKHWTLLQVNLTSSGPGWGTSTLKRDADEIAEIVKYFRKIISADKRIVLMGHSTGCQDAMEYVTGPGNDTRLPLNGIILQAPVSDREFLSVQDEVAEAIVKLARSYLDEGRAEDVLPLSTTKPIYGDTAVSAYRCYSLMSPNKDGDDDYFSSDLPVQKLKKTFGVFAPRTPLLFLYSGNDEFVPKSFDAKKLLKKWTDVVKEGGGIVDEDNSGIIQGASHNLQGNDSQVVFQLCNKVYNFLGKIDYGLGSP